jgi:hypothetical protein
VYSHELGVVLAALNDVGAKELNFDCLWVEPTLEQVFNTLLGGAVNEG